MPRYEYIDGIPTDPARDAWERSRLNAINGEDETLNRSKLNSLTRRLGQYAGTLIAGGVTIGLAGYALAGKGNMTSRGAALAGAFVGSLLTLGLFDDESCTSDYQRGQRG